MPIRWVHLAGADPPDPESLPAAGISAMAVITGITGHWFRYGSALPIIRYSTVDEAVATANALDVGLGATVWSADPAAARTVAARIEAGTEWINTQGPVDPRVPFGGAKQSGYGLEFGV